nr:hypothetical protein [Tanacetum cinerariifolium]
MLRESLNFSEESVKKSWGKNRLIKAIQSSSHVSIVPSLSSSSHVFSSLVSDRGNIISIDVIDEILEEDFDALLDEGSEILHSIEGTILEEKLFAEFDKFMALDIEENSESESKTEEIPFEKITFNNDYKIKTSLEEPP